MIISLNCFGKTERVSCSCKNNERRGDSDLNIASRGRDGGHGKVEVVFGTFEGTEIHRSWPDSTVFSEMYAHKHFSGVF